MNAPIIRLFVATLVLFAVLVGFTSNWSVFEASDLQAKTQNKRPLFEAQQVERGKIVSSDGEVIADSKRRGKGDSLRYVRTYPLGDLFGNPVGYSFLSEGQTQLELTQQDVLTGQSNEFVSLLDQIQGQAQQGSDVVTTLNAAAQRVAAQQLAGRPGAVVAIEPQTGAVRVMQSTPGYDPNRIPTELSQLNQAPDAPLVDRPVQSTYPTGSTMKVVTAAAALDSGKVAADQPIDALSPMTFSGVPLSNDFDQSFPGETMEDALTNSVNTYFAQVGEMIGPDTLLEYMRRFGFESDPELQLPDDQMTPSGIFNSNGKLVDSGFDIARVAIGQGGEEGQLRATPFQMAEVAATIANDGTLMKPSLIEAIKDPDGRTTEKLDPEKQSDVLSSETASTLAQMMTSVVDTGTAAGLGGDLGGTTFAGKTGTAEINIPNDIAQPWFIAFAPVDNPQIAVAATVERCQGCFGGDTAGPIATAVMSEILNGGG